MLMSLEEESSTLPHLHLAPLAIAVVAADIVIGIVITEGERLPIDSVQIKHILTFFAICAFLKVSFGTAKKNTIMTSVLAPVILKKEREK